MRAAKMKERPSFQLMVQTDVQSIYHMQMPRWLFSDPRYCEMSLDAKVTYTFLLNRFQLSRRNGWVNERGEVFVIFPRKALAKELRICEQRVTAAFKKLVELELVWEKRCGRGDANQIYLAYVTPQDDPNYPRWDETDDERDKRLETSYEYTRTYPITLIYTDAGWRFDAFTTPNQADMQCLGEWDGIEEIDFYGNASSP